MALRKCVEIVGTGKRIIRMDIDTNNIVQDINDKSRAIDIERLKRTILCVE